MESQGIKRRNVKDKRLCTGRPPQHRMPIFRHVIDLVETFPTVYGIVGYLHGNLK